MSNYIPLSQQESTKASLHEGVHPNQEAQRQQEQFTEEKEVDEDYEVYQAHIIREASTLDDMAKLITIEEV